MPFSESVLARIYILFMSVIAAAGIMDIIFDRYKIIGSVHIFFEIGFIFFAAASGSFIWYHHKKNHELLLQSEKKLKEITRERDEWRKKHETSIRTIHDGVVEQLHKWDFSSSEIEVALLIIRGLSHKQIAGMLDKSERTVRNQSINIYKKSGMVGRSELTAFFIEDLFSFDEEV